MKKDSKRLYLELSSIDKEKLTSVVGPDANLRKNTKEGKGKNAQDTGGI